MCPGARQLRARHPEPRCRSLPSASRGAHWARNRQSLCPSQHLDELAMGGGRDQRQGAGGQRGPHGASSSGFAPGKRTLTEQLPVQCSTGSVPALVDTEASAVQHAATQGVASAGSSLPHADTIQRLFGRHDIRGVEAHMGGEAAVATHAIGAEAYATGHHVAFASSPSLHTAAHEAAHVIQQRGGVQLKDGVGWSGDAHEQHANAVADLVVQGKSAEASLDGYASAGGGPAAVQRKPDDVPSLQRPEGARVDRLIQLLAAPAAAAAGRDDVYMLLSSLGIPELLAVMEGVADRGYLPQLHARVSSWTNPISVARLLSALYAVELVRVPPDAVATGQLKAAGMALDLLPHDQQVQIVEYVLHHRGAGVSVTEVFEGALAMREGKDAARDPQVHGGSAATAGPMATAATGSAPAPVEPDPWAPPGEQPIPFYIGNAAHIGIAASYVAAHGGEVVRTNASPVGSMLTTLKRTLGAQGEKIDKGALSEDELALMPDITNLTRLHLYEIKPLAAEAAGAAKAAMYASLFAKAGVAVALGPTTEPGVEGGIPAPAGVYMFWSPQPGVIVYQYRKGRLVPVPVGEPEPAGERRWKFELRPMTPQQQAAVTTLTVGGMLLLIAMILLAPVGA
ncbi:MAG TPA: DUF4157 domain-containing protein [Kofleriaceae bacterium]